MSAAKHDLVDPISRLSDVATEALRLAKQEGASAADAFVNLSTEFEVKVADNAIVSLTQATQKALGLRVFVEGRMGLCTIRDFSSESLAQAVTRAVQMAREAAADPFNGLAEAQIGVLVNSAGLDLFDSAIVDLATDTKIRMAKDLEVAARETSPFITRFRDSGVSTSVGYSVLATSTGAVRTQSGTGISLWCNPLACKDDELQTEFWYDSRTHLADLESVASIGKKAAQRAVRMLGAKPVKTQEAAVIFEPQMAAGLFAAILPAIDGDMVFKKATFLTEKLGAQIATPGLSFVDDPTLKRGVGSTAFDAEGLHTSKKRILDAGKLTTFLYDSYTARKAKTQPTGNAHRGVGSPPSAGVFNFYAEAGKDSTDEILRSVDKALIITRGLGRGLNTVSGEYSRGANGLWVERGEIVHPVQEVTIAGDYLQMLQDIDRIGSDLEMRGSFGAPTIRIAKMMVSGS